MPEVSHFPDPAGLQVIEVLLVEDDPGDVLMTTEAFGLSSLHSTLHVAGDGEQALRFLRRSGEYTGAPRPSLILLDLNLPRRNGLEVLAELKSDGRAVPGTSNHGDGVRDEVTPEAMTRIVLRPVASSLPLGFLAFGVGTILLTALELKWVPPAQGSTLMVMVLAFVAPLQALAGVFAFLARDSGAATALTMLGAAWTATALTVLRVPPGGTSASLAIFC
jgi:CheY-like chemotaxis protein